MNRKSSRFAGRCGSCIVPATRARASATRPTAADRETPLHTQPFSRTLIRAARRLASEASALTFAPPVVCVYNPLVYAWEAHATYLEKFALASKRVVFLGMNPGPFGMTQTGIPFGEVAIVRDWLGIRCRIGKPPVEHSRRPVLGFDCPRSEVSGRRLWGLFASRHQSAADFFREHIVINYCPLTFVEGSGRNRTPDKLPAAEKERLFSVCDRHLRAVVAALRPEWLIGVGDFAAKRAARAFADTTIKLGCIAHPSPANPAANCDWAARVTQQLEVLGVWKRR